MKTTTTHDEMNPKDGSEEPPGRWHPSHSEMEMDVDVDSEDEVDRHLHINNDEEHKHTRPAILNRTVTGGTTQSDVEAPTTPKIPAGTSESPARTKVEVAGRKKTWFGRLPFRQHISPPAPALPLSGAEPALDPHRLPLPTTRSRSRPQSRASTPLTLPPLLPSHQEEEDERPGSHEEEEESDGMEEKMCRICFTGEDSDSDDEGDPSDSEAEDDGQDQDRAQGEDQGEKKDRTAAAGKQARDQKKQKKKKAKDTNPGPGSGPGSGLGRLISPCLCRGSMRHVHISCLQQWRGKGRNKKAYMECTQCKFRYRLRRTRFLGLASSPIILFITSLVLFLALTLAVGSGLHWLMRFSRFRRLVAGPTERRPRMLKLVRKKNRISRWLPFQMEDTQEEFEAAVRQDPLVPIGIELPGGFTYMQPSSGMFELVIRSMRAFVNGEAQEVGEGIWQMLVDAADYLEVYKAGHYALLPFRLVSKLAAIVGLGRFVTFLGPIIERFSLGFSLIGSISFATLLITSSLMAPFQLANNVRIGRGGGPFGLPMGVIGGRRRAAQARVATMQTGQLGTVGIGSLVLVMFVIMGAVRAITQLYSFTNYLAVILLTKAENAILEVNRRGEVIEDARAITMRDGGRMVRVQE